MPQPGFGVAAQCPDGMAGSQVLGYGGEWERLLLLIQSEATAGRKANSAKMETDK